MTDSAWASLDDERVPDIPSSSPAATAWQSLDDDPEPEAHPLPEPELAASQLRVGEILWARVEGQTATLGSKQPLHLPAGIPDKIGGWRRVRITDADTLSAEVLVFPVEQPVLNVADEPAQLFPPEPTRSPPSRPPGFPVGEGGDLSAAFEARVRHAKENHLRAAEAAREDFQRRSDQLEQRLREDHEMRIRAAERQAERAYHEAVRRIRDDATQQIERARQAVMQNKELRRKAEEERDRLEEVLARTNQERLLGIVAAITGWVFVLLLLALLLN